MRTSTTRHAVMRSDNFNGLGKVPAATLRHSVGALNGKGAAMLGRLGLCTSCASRINALSGSSSNSRIVVATDLIVVADWVIEETGVFFALLGFDIY